MTEIKSILKSLPNGYSEVIYMGLKYGMTVNRFNNDRSVKVYAKALSETDFISLNFYETPTSDYFKPCEMPMGKVIHFLRNYKIIEE